MTLAVIIPVKNEEKNLPFILDSIKKQTYKDIKIIVANSPDSTDRTEEIARKNKCLVIKGGMPSFGRNRGAEEAIKQGCDIMMFIDADIFFPSRYFLENAVREIKKRNLDVAGTMQMPFDSRAKSHGILRKSRDFRMNSFYGIANCIIYLFQDTERPFMQQCMFARADVYKAISGFDESLEFGEDSEYAKRAVEHGFKFRILKTPGNILVSPRRLENQFWKMLAYYLYFNIAILFGHKFPVSKVDYYSL